MKRAILIAALAAMSVLSGCHIPEQFVEQQKVFVEEAL